jgi:hypothetical protein
VWPELAPDVPVVCVCVADPTFTVEPPPVLTVSVADGALVVDDECVWPDSAADVNDP